MVYRREDRRVNVILIPLGYYRVLNRVRILLGFHFGNNPGDRMNVDLRDMTGEGEDCNRAREKTM